MGEAAGAGTCIITSMYAYIMSITGCNYVEGAGRGCGVTGCVGVGVEVGVGVPRKSCATRCGRFFLPARVARGESISGQSFQPGVLGSFADMV